MAVNACALPLALTLACCQSSAGFVPALLELQWFPESFRIVRGVFDAEDECREWIARGKVSVLRREGVFLGIGLLTRVWSTRGEHDVGVMVHPDYRGHGYASFILRSLKRRCLEQGMRPTAGCATENVASTRALHRAGFVSQHSLIRFERLVD